MSILDRKHILTIDLDDSSIDYSKNIKFYNTDKGISNLYVRIRKTDDDGAKNYLNESDLKGLKLNLTVIKPKTNQIRSMTGILTKELTTHTCAIYKFELSNEFTNQIGIVCGEFELTDEVEYVTIDPFSYEIKASKLTGLNAEIISNPDLPVLKELIKKVEETVQAVNNIDDNTPSRTMTYSSTNIESKLSKKANESDLAVEKARIDNLITNNNPTEGNSELIDIRVGADGTAYASAGESVGTQFNNHKAQLQQITEKNDTQDTRLKEVENKNKIQDIYLSGLFNENANGRLTIEGEGNSVKLEGSKAGLVEVESIKGNTLVNLVPSDNKYLVSYPSSNPDNIICTSLGRGMQAKIPSSLTDYLYFGINLNMSLIKPNTTYTLLCETKGISYLCICSGNRTQMASDNQVLPSLEASFNKVVITTNDLSTIDGTKDIMFYARVDKSCTGTVYFKHGCILEGDYTNKPIPSEYFEGLQSSFEDKLITQDMIDEGLEEAENLGKYKVPVRVVGKNLFDINNLEPIDKQDSSYEVVNGNTLRIISTITTISTSTYLYHRFKVNLHGEKRLVLSAKGIPQTVDMNSSVKFGIRFYNSNKETVGIAQSTSSSYLVVDVPNGASYCGIFFYVCVGQSGIAKGSYIDYTNIQLEEVEAGVSSPSTYEPYFERTTNVYLNSPLLEGDEIVMNNGELCHYHNRKLRDDLHSLNWTYLNQYDTDDSVVFNTSDVKDYPLDTQAASFDILSDKFKSASYVVSANTHYSICLMDNLKGLRVRVPKSALTEVTPTGLQTLLKNMNSKIIYQLAQPYYEPIQADKLLLECANDSTLHIDTLIPTESIKVSYTGNIPSVYVLEATGEQNTYDIADTQIAVDYLLMSSRELGVMAMSLNTEDNLTKKGMNTMGAYFASRIMKGYLDYSTVVKKYPEFKEDIDFILRSEGREDLIVS